jgi:AraC family transcriptional regulator
MNERLAHRQNGDPRALHDPVETLRVRLLHHSPTVSVYDVSCRPCNFKQGAEESSQTDQIVFPRRGVFQRESRGQRVLADANHALFFNRDEGYHIAHPADSGDDCTVFAFDDALLREAVAVHDPAWAEDAQQTFRFTHALNGQAVYLLHEQLRRAAQDGRGAALAIDEAAVELLGALMRAAYEGRDIRTKRCRESTTHMHREQMQRTALLLATRFAEDLPLAAIAREVHCSPFHLARLFRRQAGVTIHQYRHRLRLREALRCLAGGERDLARLALELGFSSHSHFSDAFRLAFGMSPGACRKAPGTRRLHELSKNLEVPSATGS